MVKLSNSNLQSQRILGVKTLHLNVPQSTCKHIISKVKMYHKRAIYIVDIVFIITIKLGITKPSGN